MMSGVFWSAMRCTPFCQIALRLAGLTVQVYRLRANKSPLRHFFAYFRIQSSVFRAQAGGLRGKRTVSKRGEAGRTATRSGESGPSEGPARNRLDRLAEAV